MRQRRAHVPERPRASSGGVASAVADGLLPITEGSDAGGSIGIPVDWYDVYGYKASFGRMRFLVCPNVLGAAGTRLSFLKRRPPRPSRMQ